MAVKFEVIVETITKNAIAAMAGFSKQSTKDLEKVESAVNSINGTLKTLAGLAIAGLGFHKLTEAIHESISAASEHESALQKLNVALKIAGEFSEANVKRFEDLGRSISRSTGVSANAVIGQVAYSKQLGFTNDQTEKIIKTASDLSAVMGTDLSTATETLIKSYSGQSRELQKLFPDIKALTFEQLVQGQAVDILSGKFKGVAAALTNTYAGALKASEQAHHGFAAALGSIITESPVMINRLKNSAEFFLNLKKIVLENKDAIIDFVNSGIKSVLDAIPVFINGIKILYNILLGLKSVILGITASVAVLPGALVEALKSGNLTPLKEAGKIVADAFLEPFQGNDKINKIFDQASEAAKKQAIALTDLGDKEIKIEAKKLGLVNDRIRATDELIRKERQRIDQARKGIVSGFSGKPIEALFGNVPEIEGASADDNKKTKGQVRASGVAGVLAESLKGSQGAADLISQAAGFLGDALFGLGPVVSQIVSVFAQGPDKVKEFIDGFIQGIPLIIENIILSIPQVITSLVDSLDPFVQKLVDDAPKIVDQIVASLPELFAKLNAQLPFISQKLAIELALQAPFIALQFQIALIKSAPLFVQAMIDEVKKGIGSLGGIFGGSGGGLGGSLGSVVSSVGDIFGFAEGGMPRFAGGDNLLAGFNANELVVDKSDTQRLSSFLDKQATNDGLAAVSAKLDRLLSGKSGATTQVTVPIQLDRKVLGEAVFELRSDGFRV